MKRISLLLLWALAAIGVSASTTLPLRGRVIKANDPHLQYVGRISFQNPLSPRFSYPGTQVIAAFEGTSLRMIAKPGSGYFVAQIDEAEPFKVAFRGERDSVASLATALPRGRHTVRLMYSVEGYEYLPEFRGFILDADGTILDAPALPDRRIEFVGNSITCGYGNESIDAHDHFEFETENHYYSYAQLTARQLCAQSYIVARSGIGVYRNYGGPKSGTPADNIQAQYEYTLYNDHSERWDFARFQPQLVCINLGTNDLSTDNYDERLLKKAYKQFLATVRSHNPQAKIVFLCGSMLSGKELGIARRILNEVADEARQAGDQEVYRFDFTPHTGDLYYGADYHPSLWQHQKMAAELTAYLRALMQWF